MIKLMGPRVLIERSDEPKLQSSLLEIVSHSDEPSQFATVLAVGTGALTPRGDRVPIDVAEGDKIVTTRYAGTPVTLYNEEYFVVMESDILAVLED